MLFPASIRWRLQIWLGILLIGLLTAFGTTAWQSERNQRLRRLDDELEKQASLLGAAIRGPEPRGPGGPGFRRHGGPPGGFQSMKDRGGPPGEGLDRPDGNDPGDGPQDWFKRDHEPPEFREDRLPPGLKAFFESSTEGFYYVVWNGWSMEAKSSVQAPSEVPMPQRRDKTTQIRFRDRQGVREAYYFTERGDCVLAGRPVEKDLATMRPVAVTLSLTGLGVLALGLGGGWWLTSRSIRPIEQIAAAAQRISESNLSERIPSSPPGSELNVLSDVLNTTFSRLEASFSQQKRFTSDASHELRTPLTVLISETQTALSRERSPDEYREVLAGNLDTARQMKRLAEALLELARLDSGDNGRAMVFDMAFVARESAARLVNLAAAKSISLELDLMPATLSGSPDRFALVVTNLIENAIHYGRNGGWVKVATSAPGDRVELTIADNGAGISPEDLPHIFERFYRADKARSRSGGRYGLGLAICQGMVHADGGTISVESELNEGSSFRVSYPASTGEE